jgi:hypothetical protein
MKIDAILLIKREGKVGKESSRLLLDCYIFLAIKQYLHCYQYIAN